MKQIKWDGSSIDEAARVIYEITNDYSSVEDVKEEIIRHSQKTLDEWDTYSTDPLICFNDNRYHVTFIDVVEKPYDYKALVTLDPYFILQYLNKNNKAFIKMNQANISTFQQHLQHAYEDLFLNDPEYSYAAGRTTPSELASKMTLSLSKGKVNKDGEGIKRACKAVGIKHTYKAIKEYLNQ